MTSQSVFDELTKPRELMHFGKEHSNCMVKDLIQKRKNNVHPVVIRIREAGQAGSALTSAFVEFTNTPENSVICNSNIIKVQNNSVMNLFQLPPQIIAS